MNRIWLIRGDLPAEGQLDKGIKEEAEKSERMEDSKRRGINMYKHMKVEGLAMLVGIL